MKVNKCEKLDCNLKNEKVCVVHISTLKQSLNHGLVLQKLHKVIKFNEKAWLKEYIEMNTDLIKMQ